MTDRSIQENRPLNRGRFSCIIKAMTRKKKRNKVYQGPDSSQAMPTVTRYKAVVRSPLTQWWFDHKKQVRIIATVAGGVLIVGYLIYELIRIVMQ